MTQPTRGPDHDPHTYWFERCRRYARLVGAIEGLTEAGLNTDITPDDALTRIRALIAEHRAELEAERHDRERHDRHRHGGEPS
jgi:hypothetical protein